MIKCPPGCPFSGENVMKCTNGCLSSEEKAVQCYIGCLTCWEMSWPPHAPTCETMSHHDASIVENAVFFIFFLRAGAPSQTAGGLFFFSSPLTLKQPESVTAADSKPAKHLYVYLA